MAKFRQLKEGEIFWNEIREYVKEREKKDECIFCGAKKDLTIDYLLPRCFNGPDDEKNVIWVCKRCNSSKGSKYLKLVYKVLERRNMLNLDIKAIRKEICPKCDIKKLCIKEKTEGKLSPLCLDGILTLCFQKTLTNTLLKNVKI